MSSRKIVLIVAAVGVIGCATGTVEQGVGNSAPVPPPNWEVSADQSAADYPDPELGKIDPAEPVVFRDLPVVSADPRYRGWVPPEREGRPETPISEEEAARRRAESMRLQPQDGVQLIDEEPGSIEAMRAPNLETSFESINFDDGYGQTPPDPEMSVGPSHVIAVVNSMLEVYDRTGTTVYGPVSTDTFFNGVSGCSGTFDPNTLYDEKENRFFVGIDSSSGPSSDNGYCFAVSATGDPTGTWYRYSFDATANSGDFFDYPHAGIGEEAIFMGGNVFNSSSHPDVWAINKSEAYANQAVTIVRKSTSGWTPQPMNAHGFAQGTWPSGNTHYILSDAFNGTTVYVDAWTDPFGSNTYTNLGSVDLDTVTGVTAGYPIDTPQLGSTDDLQANDYRVQDAEYRNGSIWMVHTIACNPGAGTVNCIRWAEIDPTGNGGSPSVVQAGVFGSDGEYRIFADLAVNHCDDVTIGYTKSSSSAYPSVYYTGRLGTDTAGIVQAEALLKSGEGPHSSYDDAPFRWGDYSGATPDPNGVDTWYLGEYVRNNSGVSKWGNMIGRFSTSCTVTAGDPIFSDDFENGDSCSWSSQNGGTPCP